MRAGENGEGVDEELELDPEDLNGKSPLAFFPRPAFAATMHHRLSVQRHVLRLRSWR